ncbi:MAG: squalene/phytoene synthase family protein [Fibrobacteria bacterium]|jgi:farnesyl-diphosphate farnesyltransferase|nr:squalene/phytoene synthase family protein [Fibrobacteria bacterium]
MPPRGNLPEDRLWKRRLAEGPLSAAETRAFAAFALNRVSRTFALNIRVLPGPLRAQVLHAYLYCRMADTLEDDATLPAGDKIPLLRAFASLFRTDLPEDEARAAFDAFPGLLPPSWRGSEDWEKILLERAPVVLRAFLAFPAPARAAIARCVTEMCGGMADFARRREERSATGRPLIETLAELDEYCYYVAGTVGVMLCDLFIAHADIPPERAARLRALCVSFGLGLQLTNILKDVRDDGERGVSWLPPGHAYAGILAKARGHLEEALEYTLLIPRRQRRLRLFCLWPLFMAAETLALLDSQRASPADAPVARVKISRVRVARILLRTRLLYFSNTWLRAEFRRHLALPPPTGYL